VELPAHVHGLPVRAVVDSGAQFSAIDRRLAERLGLKQAPIPLLAFGVSGQPSVTHTVSLDLGLPGLQLVGLRAATLDLLTLSDVMQRPFAMLLGRDVLEALTVDVDWPNARMRFLEPGAYRPQPDARVVPTHRQSGALITSVSIEGAEPIQVMVDTGATSEIALSEPVARKLGLLAGRPVSTGRSVSLGGLGQDRVVHAAQVQFAGRTLSDVEVQVFTPSSPAPLPAGLLGVGILKHYRAGLDLSSGVLWLSGPAAAHPGHRDGPTTRLKV
jgi:predicted aspartyl protease